ncbi:hypothetical protein WH96_01685 [Kiloniella spongiae]|uniref:Glutamine amidotransferase domain-containing protein n=1 Tax=Kiloniella spongiae TaxID=1489064 RepID=A0A0H2N010_9PROT|nr:hypothetical protein [Kiloniella spongiae]KLN62260.1 hypothetical protein WH96_01685 [Kiloniella spongiae]
MISSYGIEWQPLVPMWMIYIIIGFALTSLLSLFFLKSKGGEFRAIFLAIIAVFLANPSLHKEVSEALPELVLAIVDNSPSMDYGKRKSQAANALTSLHEQVNQRSDLILKTIQINGDAENGTKLFDEIYLTAEEKERLAGIVIISDGQIHDIPKALEGTQFPQDIPLHLFLAGDPDKGDRRIVIEQAPAFGIIDQKTELSFKIIDENINEIGVPAAITLRKNGNTVAEFQAPINQTITHELTLENRGEAIFDITAEVLDEEITPINNQAVFSANGVRDRLKVLLISGEPHPGERAWRNILKEDPSVDLIHFTILRHPTKQDGTPIRELSLIAFPIHELFEVKLADFDLIIFDQYQRQGFLPSHYLTNIVRYVKQGGALLEVGGPGYASPASLYNTSLGSILPAEPLGKVSEQAFHPLITQLGLRHPVTARLPKANLLPDEKPRWGRWFRQVETDTLGGSTLMTGNNLLPLLILDHYEEGRVAQITSDHIWLWGRNIEGGGPQTELIRRLVHWLMKEPELEEETLKAQLRDQQLSITRQTMSEDEINLTITSPSGEITETALQADTHGHASTRIEATEPGLYTINDGLNTVVAQQALSGPEHERVRTDPIPLAPIIEASNGGIYTLKDLSPKLRLVRGKGSLAGKEWAGLLSQKAEKLVGSTRTPLLPPWAFLSLLLMTAFGAWYREGR